MTREYEGIIVDDLNGTITAELINGNSPTGWTNIVFTVQADDTGDYVTSTIDISPTTAAGLSALTGPWQDVPAIAAAVAGGS